MNEWSQRCNDILFFVFIFSLLQRGLLALTCVHTIYMPGAHRGQMMAPNPQKLES